MTGADWDHTGGNRNLTGMCGCDYEYAEGNWDIPGVSVIRLGVTGNTLRATGNDWVYTESNWY